MSYFFLKKKTSYIHLQQKWLRKVPRFASYWPETALILTIAWVLWPARFAKSPIRHTHPKTSYDVSQKGRAYDQPDQRSALQFICLSRHFCWSGLLQVLRLTAFSFTVPCSYCGYLRFIGLWCHSPFGKFCFICKELSLIGSTIFFICYIVLFKVKYSNSEFKYSY